jgi:hypothetical protein
MEVKEHSCPDGSDLDALKLLSENVDRNTSIKIVGGIMSEKFVVTHGCMY